jgi:uncharacterized protein (TIGR02996 family)
VKALVRAIEGAPDDPAPYLVYGDWLQTQGDPRGTLIALQHAGEAKTPAGAKARAGARKHLDAHTDTLLGELAKYPKGDYCLGLALTWRRGFIESVELDHESPAGKRFDAKKCLEQLLAHPSAQFLRELSVHRVDAKTNDYRPIVRLLAERKLPTLRKLTIEPMEELGPKKSILGGLSSLWASCPNLTSLHLNGNDVVFGKIQLPKLQRFSIDSRNLSKQAMASICAAKWPALESMEIRPGDVGATVTVDGFQPILAARGLPKLTVLYLLEIPDTDRLCELLAKSRVAAQLVALSLELGNVTDAGAALLAARPGGWPALQRLDVSRNRLTKVGRRALVGLCPTVKSMPQHS